VSPAEVLATVDAMVTDALASYPAVRLLGEASTGMQLGDGSSMVEYEARFDEVVRGPPGADRLPVRPQPLQRRVHRPAVRGARAPARPGPAGARRRPGPHHGAPPVRRPRGRGDRPQQPAPHPRRPGGRPGRRAARARPRRQEIELDLASLRFLDVAAAASVVHAARDFPAPHRLLLSGVRPGVLRVLDRCGAPFVEQLRVEPHPGPWVPDEDGPGREERGMRVGPRRYAPAVVVPQDRPPGRAPRLQHCVAFHHGPDHLLGQLVPLAQRALEGGGSVALAVGPDTERAVRAALRGADRGGSVVALAAPRPVEAGSGQSVALRRARELRELVAVTGPLTVLAEHLPDHDGPDGRFWTELEAAEDIALADLPVHLTCFYPELPLHQSVLDGARRTHPRVLVDGELRTNPAHRSPREVLTGHPPAPPVLLGPPHHRLRFRGWQLREVRRLLREAWPPRVRRRPGRRRRARRQRGGQQRRRARRRRHRRAAPVVRLG
jgi:hypothetical protein